MFSNDKELQDIDGQLRLLNHAAQDILHEIRRFREWDFKHRLEEIEKRLRELKCHNSSF